MPLFPQYIGGCQYHTARPDAGIAHRDKRLCLQQSGRIMQLHLCHHSGHFPGGKELLKIFIAQFQLHKYTAEKITGLLRQPEYHMRK
ncbi:hypothetical protein Xmau_04576 [Xenorhabdus mauleonii]|uniref:Transposase n=1 Tax=Xenorhabdus mauleonii TaxID=351675 RepID=A0A2G0N7F0_9GAMM|nr:hypothetical protein Xmau_04576 [Xenorhabdus mauleonii]